MVRAEKASATVEFWFRSAREAEAVRQALMPEEELPASTKCRASVRRMSS